MPKIPVDECPAGPHMDAAVAELGIQFPTSIEYDEDGNLRYYHSDGMWGELVSSYSTDIAAAWGFEKSLEVDQRFDYIMHLFNLVATDLGAPDFLTFNKAVYWRMTHASPLDRCRAFLKANGVEFVEVLKGND
jgi:hypothetical protein